MPAQPHSLHCGGDKERKWVNLSLQEFNSLHHNHINCTSEWSAHCELRVVDSLIGDVARAERSPAFPIQRMTADEGSSLTQHRPVKAVLTYRLSHCCWFRSWSESNHREVQVTSFILIIIMLEMSAVSAALCCLSDLFELTGRLRQV